MHFIKRTLFIVVFAVFLLPNVLICKAEENRSQVYEAVIQNVSDKKAEILVTSGNLKGKSFTTDTVINPNQQTYSKGDKVIITYSNVQGNEAVYITDLPRQTPLLVLFILFIAVTLIICRWQGLASLIAMFLTFIIIGKFIIPNILLGNNPVLITILGALVILPLTYYISHGISKKTTVALVSTVITLLLTGLLAYIFVEMSKLTGFDSEEASFVKSLGFNVDIQSLLLAGLIIGILAVMDDITISQASVVSSIYKAKPSLSLKELFSSAMTVGRDHIASLVNTLILVYAGASLPLFLLFHNVSTPFHLIINQEIIATEIIRSLVSSLGIIAAVPLTTFLAAIAYKKNWL